MIAYLDTTIVSVIAKEDLKPEDQDALLKILDVRKRGGLSIVTSEVAKDELNEIPEEYRFKHSAIYRLLEDVPVGKTFEKTTPGSMGMGMGMSMGAGGRKLDPLFVALKDLLPDEQDANHLFQAAKNKAEFFLTADERTILRYRDEIEEVCGVKAFRPKDFIDIISDNE